MPEMKETDAFDHRSVVSVYFCFDVQFSSVFIVLFSFVLYWSVLNCVVSVMTECYSRWLLFQFDFDRPVFNVDALLLSCWVQIYSFVISTVFVTVYPLSLSQFINFICHQMCLSNSAQWTARDLLNVAALLGANIFLSLYQLCFINCICLCSSNCFVSHYQLYLSQFIHCICLSLSTAFVSVNQLYLSQFINCISYTEQ